MNSRIAVTGLGLAALVSLACGIRELRQPASRRPRRPPLPSAAATSPAGSAGDDARAVIMDSVVLGHSLAPDGSVSAPGTSFAQGAPLFVSLRVSAISPGTEVKLSWYAPDGKGEGDDQLVVPPGASVVNFRAKDTSAWPLGTHRVEIWVGGAKAGEKVFTVSGPGSPAAGSVPR